MSFGVVTSFVAAGVVVLVLFIFGAWVGYRQFTTWREMRRLEKTKKMQLQQIFKDRSFDARDWSLYTVATDDIERFRKQMHSAKAKDTLNKAEPLSIEVAV